MPDRIRVAVAGLGNRGVWALQTLMKSDEFELAATVEPIGARVAFLQNELKIPSSVGAFTNLSDCLKATDVDAVMVFTPDGVHAESVRAALSAGRWVFVEKPLEITILSVEQIIEADRRAAGKTFVGFNLRFAPMYRAIKSLIDSDEVGQLLTIQMDEFYDGGRTYFRRWNRLSSMGGGLWLTKCCHDFDMMYWLAGASPVQVHANSALSYYRPRVDAAMYCRDCSLAPDCPDRYDRYVPAGSIGAGLYEATERQTGERPDLCLFNSDKDTFDHGQAMVRFANESTGIYTVNVVAGFSNRRIRVSGTKATIDGDLNSGVVIVRRRDPAREERIEPGSGQMHGGGDECILPEFAAFVRGQPAARVVRPTEAAVSIRMGLAATESCRTGQAVNL